MKTCKVKPSASECRMCADICDEHDQIPKCDKCGYKALKYELLEIVSGIFNDYAFVQRDGKISKVALDNVYDIKEENRNV